MADRNVLYRKFGPLITEALFLMTLEQINILRVRAGLPAYTREQAETRLEQTLATLPPYDWMNPEP